MKLPRARRPPRNRPRWDSHDPRAATVLQGRGLREKSAFGFGIRRDLITRLTSSANPLKVAWTRRPPGSVVVNRPGNMPRSLCLDRERRAILDHDVLESRDGRAARPVSASGWKMLDEPSNI